MCTAGAGGRQQPSRRRPVHEAGRVNPAMAVHARDRHPSRGVSPDRQGRGGRGGHGSRRPSSNEAAREHEVQMDPRRAEVPMIARMRTAHTRSTKPDYRVLRPSRRRRRRSATASVSSRSPSAVVRRIMRNSYGVLGNTLGRTAAGAEPRCGPAGAPHASHNHCAGASTSAANGTTVRWSPPHQYSAPRRAAGVAPRSIWLLTATRRLARSRRATGSPRPNRYG
jgi:hypothetical protein